MIIFGISGASSKNTINNLGGFTNTSSMEKFHDDLRILLETKKGTQIGDPSFGSDLSDLLYEPANVTTASQIRQEVARTIENYYTNVNIQSVDVTFRKYTVQLLITYQLISTNVGDTVMLEFIRAS